MVKRLCPEIGHEFAFDPTSLFGLARGRSQDRVMRVGFVSVFNEEAARPSAAE